MDIKLCLLLGMVEVNSLCGLLGKGGGMDGRVGWRLAECSWQGCSPLTTPLPAVAAVSPFPQVLWCLASCRPSSGSPFETVA